MTTISARITTRRRAWGAAAVLVVIGLIVGWRWSRPRCIPSEPTEIYRGVTYGCRHLPASDDGRGCLHWVRIDLASPGVQLYVTPKDPAAVARGWEYRLETTTSAVSRERLAVGINACHFDSDSWWIPRTGDFARSVETAVSDHDVNHVWEHTYLLWFDDDLTPKLETRKPPSEEALGRARWGVGGQGVGLTGGKVKEHAARGPPDARTAIGIDAERKLLFFAVFERATPRRALEELAALGARDGMLLDGGDSSALAIGAQARGVQPGGKFRGRRSAVATHIGVRAEPLGDSPG